MMKFLISFISFVFAICMTHLYLIHYSKLLENKLIQYSKLLEKTSLNERLLKNTTFCRPKNETFLEVKEIQKHNETLHTSDKYMTKGQITNLPKRPNITMP